ncbi:hypothetical protein CYY_006728 [Polysphondylium violaceum]|uniref:Condensin complex subunit 2 n=1 Tax=Polysphondylium violaceum TaxID=133409 RepID=A0A8J4UYS5_9MYCE|nr:hypothetical protein CYY_006728 [Polysphondylium violaceum]
MSSTTSDSTSLRKRRLSVVTNPNKKLKDDNNNANNTNNNNIVIEDNIELNNKIQDNINNNNGNSNNNNIVKRRKSVLPQQQQKVTRFAPDVLDKENKKEEQNNNLEDNEDYYTDLENLFNTTTTTQQQQQLAAVPKLKRKSVLPADITLPPSIPSIVTNSKKQQQQQPSRQPLNNSQISEVYKNIIKLSTENKITIKNTWELPLIDYIDNVIESNNFQEASCTLDASVQIYATRVDSIHTDTYRYLGGLNRVEDNDNDDNDDDDNNHDPNSDQVKRREKRKKRVDVNTLENNPENITLKSIDLAFTVDPLFKKTSAAFDEGGVKGLLLNHLSTYGNCRLIFDSNDFINEKVVDTSTADDIISSNPTSSNQQQESTTTTTTTTTIDISEWSSLFKYNSREKICPTLNGFNNWTVKSIVVDGDNDDNNDNNNDNGDDDEFQQSDDDIQQFYDSNGKINLENTTDEFENSGIHPIDFDDMPAIGGGYDDRDDFQPFPENADDEDDHYGGDGGVAYDDDYNNNNQQQPHQQQQQNIIIDNQDWEEFEFFGPGVTENWTGPEHWKFKSKKKQTTANTMDDDDEDNEENEKPNKRKKTSKVVYLDFDAPPPSESLFEPGKNTTLTNAALKKAAESSTILPPDIHYDIKMLSRLFNKPKCTIPPMSKRDTVFRRRTTISSTTLNNDNTLESNEDGFGNNMTLISNDHDLPFSQTNEDTHVYGGGYDDDYDEDPEERYGRGSAIYDPTEDIERNNSQLEFTNNNNNTTLPTSSNFGDMLVAEPRKVEKLEAKYVKVPKKFDVKSFKQNVWSILEKDKDQQSTTTTSATTPTSTIPSSTSILSTVNEKPEFANLLKELEEKQPDKKEELSVGLAFMCLLDLANEKNLVLAQTGIDNLFISTK